jgi:HAMP domain-containing protein
MKTESADLFVMKMIYRLSDEASLQETAQKLAQELNITTQKAVDVLNRFPGPLIKPMDRNRVEEIANSFIRVGVPVEIFPANSNPPTQALNTGSLPMSLEPLGMTSSFNSAPMMPLMAPMTPMGSSNLGSGNLGSSSLGSSSTVTTYPAMTAISAPGEAEAEETEYEEAASLESIARTSLRTKLVASSLVPVLFIGLSALSLLAINVPRGLNELDQSRAQQLASALVVDLQPAETLRNNQHLREAVQTSGGDIAFVDLAIPNDPKQSMFISNEISTDVQGSQAFNTFKSTPEFQVQKPHWQTPGIVEGALEIFKAQVFEDSIGKRTMQFANQLGEFKAPSATDKKIFDVSFGYSTARAQSIILQQLGLMSALIGLVLASAAGLALLFSRSLSKSIIRLTEAADTISLGEFDVPVEKRSNDELGDLAEALERMRLSLRAALERLRRRR